MNSSFENAERGLKRWLKREAKITMATVVTFLITGAVSYGADAVIKNFETQPGKEEIFDYKNGNQTIGNGQIGFSNNKENTLGTVIGNGTLTVGNGGKGYVTTDGGKIFFHAGTEVNVGSGGTGFYTTTGKGNTITSTASGTNYIGHGIVLSAGTINVKGDNFAAGFKAEDGGSIQVGNGRGARATINIDGIGAHIKGNSYISFEADSDTYVNNGFGIFFDKIDNSNSDNPNAIIKNGATFTVNEDIGVNLAGGTKAVVTNESGKFIVNDGTVGFQVDANNEYLKINNRAANSKIIVKKGGIGVKAEKGGYAYYHGQGTIGEMVVEKGGIGFYTNAESEFGTSTKDNGIKESIYLPGGNITVNGGIGFKADGTGAMAIGNDTANSGSHNTYINVNAGGKGVLLQGNSTAVLGGDARLTVNEGRGIELEAIDQTPFPKLTLKKGSIVTVNGTNAVGINFIGNNYDNTTTEKFIVNNGTINVTNGVGILASGEKNIGDYFDYSDNETSGKITVSGENSVGVKIENGGYIRFSGSNAEKSGVSVSNKGIGFLVNGKGGSKNSQLYLRGGNINVDNATGLKAINGGDLIIGAASDSYAVNINVKGNGIGVSLDNGTATLGADVNLTVDDGVGVKFGSGANTFTNNTSNFVVNGENAVGFLADGTNGENKILNSTKDISKITVEKGIGIKTIDGGYVWYAGQAHDGVLEVKKDGIGFYTNSASSVKTSGLKLEGSGIYISGANVDILEGIGFKADGTGIMNIGNVNTNPNKNNNTFIDVDGNGLGISLADKAKALLDKDATLTVNSGIGAELKGESTLTIYGNNTGENGAGIVVNGNSIGIDVSGVGENNNVKVNSNAYRKQDENFTGLISVAGTGTGLHASDLGNVLNYESGKIEVTSADAYGVIAENGATIHFGNNKLGSNDVDGINFDTFLNVADKGTGIKIGENAIVTVNKDVEITLGENSKLAELAGGTFENNTNITIDDGKIGIVGGSGTITGTGTLTAGTNGTAVSINGGKITNNGNIAVGQGGTGFVGTGSEEIINNGTISVGTTSDLGEKIKITSNGSIQLSDSDAEELKSTEELEKLLQDTLGEDRDLITIKGLIKNQDGNVIFVAGKEIGPDVDPSVGIPVDPDGKITIDDLKENLEDDEDTVKTDTGTDVTITGPGTGPGKLVINVGGKLTIDGGDEGLTLKDTQIQTYDKENEGEDVDDDLVFTGKVTVDNTDSNKLINVDDDKLVIGTGTGKTDVTFIGGQITGEEGKNGGIVITGDDDTLTLDKINVGIGIGTGTGTLVIGTGVTTQGITVGTTIVTGTGNETGKVKTEDLTITGGGELTSTGIEAGTVTFEDGTIDVSGEGGKIDIATGITVEKGKYGEILGGDIDLGKAGGIFVKENGKLTLDGNTTVGSKDDGNINIEVEKDGTFTNKGIFTGNGNLDINSGNYIFGEDGEDSTTGITGNKITVDEGTLTFKGNSEIKLGLKDDGTVSGGSISVGTEEDKDGTGSVTFAPESHFADGSNITFETGKDGNINIALGDNKDENSILGNPGKGANLNFTNVADGSIKFNTDRLTIDEKVITLNTTNKPGETPFIEGLDEKDLYSGKDDVYTVEFKDGGDGNNDQIILSYNHKLLEEYGGKLESIGSAFKVINDRVADAVNKMIAENPSLTVKEARAKLADSIYSANIYSETVRMSYDNLKMSEDAVLSLKHRTAKGELAGEGKALHSKTEYTREGILGNTSSDSEITGLLGAVEYGLSDNTRVGGVFSGSIQDLDAENGKADGNAFYVGAYINKHTSKYEVTAGAGYQFNKFETDNTYLGNTGTEKYDSHALSAYVHGRRIIDLGDGLSFQPKAKLSYSLIEQDDVKDNFMATKDAEIGIFEAEAGFDVVKSIYTDKAKVDVVFGTSLAKAMGDTDKEFEGSFFNEKETSHEFDVMGAEIGENKIKFNVGAEVSYESGLFWNGEFNYSFGSKDTETYGVSVGAGYKF